jgi:hypothetical protein
MQNKVKYYLKNEYSTEASKRPQWLTWLGVVLVFGKFRRVTDARSILSKVEGNTAKAGPAGEWYNGM